ncbi:MAG: hypothetical protein GY953_04670, partial [bacterium]|nr:hypothetical protein [bacterium]
LGVALTALATLVLELSLTRIFSVVFYYHFAFLAISVALFGLGAGGLLSYLFRGRSPRLFWKLGALAALNSVCVVGSLVFVLTRSGTLGTGTLALIYLMSALPFFLAGCVVSTVIAETVEQVNRVYFFDLLGAAAGCMLLVPLLDFVGAPNTVIGAAILYASTAGIWYTLAGSRRARAAAVVLALALAALVVVNVKRPLIDVRYAKGEELSGELFVKWNSFSRVAVTPLNGTGEISIRVDADAASGVANFDFDRLGDEDRRLLLSQGPALPYALRPGARTLILEPGGGLDIARALASGSEDVTGVENNPIIANTVMRERFSEASHRLYSRPQVHIIVGDGRSFVRSSRERFQVLQATLMERWSSTSAGTLALAENNLLTTEAFTDYLDRLTDDGVMVFSEWGVDPPRESLRLVSLAKESLGRIGEQEPWRHIIVVRENPDAAGASCRDTVLVARRPLSEQDLARALAFLESGVVKAQYLPGQVDGSPYAELLRGADAAAYLGRYPYDVSPVDDNRPFFSYTAPPGAFWDVLMNPSRLNDDAGGDEAVPLLVRLVGIGVLATAIVGMLPFALLRGYLPREPSVRRFLSYFVFVGAGYILIQVALIQKFVLFLGHPTYALTVIVFSMLVSSGLG